MSEGFSIFKLLLYLVPIGIVLFFWLIIFPFLNRKMIQRSEEVSRKIIQDPKYASKFLVSYNKMAKRIILSNRIERIITMMVIALLAIFGILYLLRLISR